jgi:hypothetical protein
MVKIRGNAGRARMHTCDLTKRTSRSTGIIGAKASCPALPVPLILEPSSAILRHLKLWDQPERPPPTPPPRTLHYDVDLPAWDDPLPPFHRAG